jgi:hypothetical protein
LRLRNQFTRINAQGFAESGSFKCTVCNTEVHKWSGINHYSDWRQIAIGSAGKR